ncbi:MAG: phosphomannomutase/phosphoglucomutase [Deltaproteobacteria bacterium]|nr:MAG: phosphomannomutase/phosphoglucomutase [Deltaproteobacteria bacterium]
MAVPLHVFREYDIRGLVSSELTPAFAEQLGRGFGHYLLQRDPAAQSIVLGRDHRTSSEPLAAAFSRGVRSHGVEVISIGVVPTPVTYFSAHTLPVDGFCMITGSHNPPEYNGFKLGIGKTTFAGPEVQELKKHVLDARDGGRQAREVEHDAVIPYIHFIVQSLGMTERPLRVVCDAGNGTGGMVGPRLLRALGHHVIELFCQLDGTFPNHHPDPTVEANLRDLIAKVAECKADLGVAWDGDADRIGAIDENGRILWGDQLMILFSRDVLRERPGATIVSEVKCSQTLYDDIEKHGGRAIMWKAGHSLIKAKMAEEHALLAGEMSGHLFFKHRYYGFDDGIYSAARLLELMARDERPLSKMLDGVPKTFSSPEIRFDFPEEKKFKAVERAKERLRKKGRTIEVDGVRVILEGGWGLVRASNTQPLLVLRYEANSEARLREIERLIQGTVEEIRRELA